MRTPYARLLTAAALLGACGGGAAGTVPRADAASVSRGVGIDDTSLDFTDGAAAELRTRATAVPPALRHTVAARADARAREDDCRRYPDADRVFALRVDGHVAPEGLAVYTLEGCGGGNNYVRQLLVLRSVGGTWHPVIETVLGAKHATRRIHGITPDALILGPSGDMPGSSEAPPDTVPLPPRGGPSR